MVGVYVGSSAIQAAYFGSTPIQNIYYGSTLLWSAASGITGSVSATLADASLLAVGDAEADLSGDLTAQLGGATLAAVAALPLQGALAGVLADAMVSSSATIGAGISAALAATLANSTAVASGTVSITGEVSRGLGNATISAEGNLVVATGSTSITLGDASLSALGDPILLGGASKTLEDATLAAAGALTLTGSLATTLAAATLTATGEVAVVSWAPTDVSGLTVWFDAGEGITYGTEPAVSSWADQSGNGETASQSTAGERPTTSTAAFGGRTSILFDGSDDNFNVSGGIYSETLAIVFAPTSTVVTGTPSMILLDTTYNQALVALGSATTAILNEIISVWGQATGGRDGISNANIPSITGGSGHILVLRESASDNRHEMNYDGNGDLANLTAGTTSAWTSHAGKMGATGIFNEYGGHIAEVVSYSGALSDTDLSKLEGYLAHKWGLEGNLPGGHPYKSAPP